MSGEEEEMGEFSKSDVHYLVDCLSKLKTASYISSFKHSDI